MTNPFIEHDGTEITAPTVHSVTRASIAEFARAVKADSPLHFDPEAAQAAGYADVIAPPTYTTLLEAVTGSLMLDVLGVDTDPDHLSHAVLHTVEHIEYSSPIVAGDELTATLRIAGVTERGPATFLNAECIISAGGKQRAVATESLVITPMEAVGQH